MPKAREAPKADVEPARPARSRPAPRATPRAVALPQPKIVLRDPVPAPPVSGDGKSVATGAAAAGQGGGGDGDGTGAGGGLGGIGRGGGGAVRRAEKIAGELRARDFPRSGAAERNGRSTIVRYDVGADGYVRNCRVTQSSGSAEADSITCRLIEQRFRYRPARDATGRAVPDVTGWRQWWWQ